MLDTQIWSLNTCCLLASCRGHDAEVTDLAVDGSGTLLASCSNDCTIRLWSLEVLGG